MSVVPPFPHPPKKTREQLERFIPTTFTIWQSYQKLTIFPRPDPWRSLWRSETPGPGYHGGDVPHHKTNIAPDNWRLGDYSLLFLEGLFSGVMLVLGWIFCWWHCLAKLSVLNLCSFRRRVKMVWTIMAVQDNNTHHVVVILQHWMDWIVTLLALRFAMLCISPFRWTGWYSPGWDTADWWEVWELFSRCLSCWNVLQAHLQFTMLNVVILWFLGQHRDSETIWKDVSRFHRKLGKHGTA